MEREFSQGNYEPTVLCISVKTSGHRMPAIIKDLRPVVRLHLSLIYAKYILYGRKSVCGAQHHSTAQPNSGCQLFNIYPIVLLVLGTQSSYPFGLVSRAKAPGLQSLPVSFASMSAVAAMRTEEYVNFLVLCMEIAAEHQQPYSPCIKKQPANTMRSTGLLES